MMDENFLFHRKRALRLLELMEQHDKSWSLYVFSSANVLRSYTIDQLVRLGISWVWMGIEGCNSQYAKLTGIDTFELVRELQSHGIRVLGSTIIGLENHTPENIDEAIDHAVRHDTDFHQFMLYTPIPGTPLHAELSAKGLMKDESEYHLSDIHGQLIFNYRHPHINDQQTAEFMLRAFDRDFEVNGPSTVRIVRTTLAGWRRHKNHPDPRVRGRYAWEARELATTFSAVVGAAKLYYRNNPAMHAKMSALLRELHAEFGWKSRLASAIGGRWVLRQIRKEEKRLAAGFSYEPPTFYERNDAVTDRPEATLCRYATPRCRGAKHAAANPSSSRSKNRQWCKESGKCGVGRAHRCSNNFIFESHQPLLLALQVIDGDSRPIFARHELEGKCDGIAFQHGGVLQIRFAGLLQMVVDSLVEFQFPGIAVHDQ